MDHDVPVSKGTHQMNTLPIYHSTRHTPVTTHTVRLSHTYTHVPKARSCGGCVAWVCMCLCVRVCGVKPSSWSIRLYARAHTQYTDRRSLNYDANIASCRPHTQRWSSQSPLTVLLCRRCWRRMPYIIHLCMSLRVPGNRGACVNL